MEIIKNFLEDKYQKKRAIISLVLSIIFLAFVFLIYSWIRPTATCNDGIKNQNEQEIDCGGVCNKCEKIISQEIIIQEVGFVENGAANKYDLYSRIFNSNNIFGSNEFQYEFRIKDLNGDVVASSRGKNFILPSESKYIIANNVEIASAPASVEFVILNSQWMELQEHLEKPQLKIVNKQYNQISSGVGFSEASGLLKNESPFDFNVIALKIILKNSDGHIIAVNSTEMRTVKSGENRDFKALWTSRFSGEVRNVDVQAETNIFNAETFIKKSFTPENSQATSYR